MKSRGPGWIGSVDRATISVVSVGFPEPANADECRKASPVAVWHSSSFHAPRSHPYALARRGESAIRAGGRGASGSDRSAATDRAAGLAPDGRHGTVGLQEAGVVDAVAGQLAGHGGDPSVGEVVVG